MAPSTRTMAPRGLKKESGVETPLSPGTKGARRRSALLHLVRRDVGVARVHRDAHVVEAAVDEDQADDEDRGAEAVLEAGFHLHRDLDREEAEERGELDHRVERNGRGVLERIAH